jgi:glycosyltransferase involved in cell wall biosynthesis
MFIDPLPPARRILIVTDAWHPQVNGVVRTLENLARELRSRGHEVSFLTPKQFWTVPVPTYPEIRLSLASSGAVFLAMTKARAHHIHIATEGPLGLLARRYCLERHKSFTTSFHTRFPEYLAARLPVPEDWSYSYLRWFHAPAAATMVPTPTLRNELTRRRFEHLSLWGRGVNIEMFAPGPRGARYADLPGPMLLYVGRVAAEKNIEAFLALDVPGTKVVVGDGPERVRLERLYPEVRFMGFLHGAELADAYRSADVMVFPSRTDTFGNVMTEALASGTPVAAYPVTGPIDVITDPRAGALSEDLGEAVTRALGCRRENARALAERFTWRASADQFFGALVAANQKRVPLATAS